MEEKKAVYENVGKKVSIAVKVGDTYLDVVLRHTKRVQKKDGSEDNTEFKSILIQNVKGRFNTMLEIPYNISKEEVNQLAQAILNVSKYFNE